MARKTSDRDWTTDQDRLVLQAYHGVVSYQEAADQIGVPRLTIMKRAWRLARTAMKRPTARERAAAAAESLRGL